MSNQDEPQNLGGFLTGLGQLANNVAKLSNDFLSGLLVPPAADSTPCTGADRVEYTQGAVARLIARYNELHVLHANPADMPVGEFYELQIIEYFLAEGTGKFCKCRTRDKLQLNGAGEATLQVFNTAWNTVRDILTAV